MLFSITLLRKKTRAQKTNETVDKLTNNLLKNK